MNLLPITIDPIGIVHSARKYRYETSRQGILAGETQSVIELLPYSNFEQALTYLPGFDRIWVVFQFHLNKNWKPMISPPRHTRKKIGVFASRAPYRPNQIGLSCVKLEKIDGLNIFISESDILDGSPVIDIKPYLPYSDSFPDAKTGWVKNTTDEIYEVVFSEKALAQINWLYEHFEINLKSFAKLQLEFNPTDNSRKRISKNEQSNTLPYYTLAYRTWRVIFDVDETTRGVLIREVYSVYTESEMQDMSNDKYQDKQQHREFVKIKSY